MKNKFTTILLVLITSNFFSQEEFEIYYLKNIYNDSTIKLIENKSNFKDFKILIQHYIDSKNEGTIDYDRIKSFLDKHYPNLDSHETLCINLENIFYNDLQLNSCGKEYRRAIRNFKNLIKFVKSLRSNLQIGIYGLPYRTYYENQLVWNKGKKLDPILKLVDVIFPSFYIIYPKEKVGVNVNLKYLKKNLDVSLEYGKRLNKKVVPFMWHTVLTNSELISFDDMECYLDYIKGYNYKGKQISGFVWWDFNNKMFKNQTFIPNHLKNKGIILDQNIIFKKYLNNFITN